MIIATMLIILISMACVLGRGIIGPTTYDRLLASNAFGTNIVLVIVLLAFLMDEMMFVDIALVYGLINFISNIALLNYFKYGDLQTEKAEDIYDG